MLTEDKRRDYTPIDPYMKQSIGQDITNIDNDETGNDIQIHDYSQFDYQHFRDKRQIKPESSALLKETLYEDDDLYIERESTVREDEEVKERFLTPLYVITAFFATMLFIGPLLVKNGPNKGIVQSSIMLAAVCMWIFWFTIYFGQMNPLMGPRLENTTVAWIAYKLGKNVGNYSSIPWTLF